MRISILVWGAMLIGSRLYGDSINTVTSLQPIDMGENAEAFAWSMATTSADGSYTTLSPSGDSLTVSSYAPGQLVVLPSPTDDMFVLSNNGLNDGGSIETMVFSKPVTAVEFAVSPEADPQGYLLTVESFDQAAGLLATDQAMFGPQWGQSPEYVAITFSAPTTSLAFGISQMYSLDDSFSLGTIYASFETATSPASASTPEPSTWLMFTGGLGLVLVGLLKRDVCKNQ
jgi:hypothetical protein